MSNEVNHNSLLTLNLRHEFTGGRIELNRELSGLTQQDLVTAYNHRLKELIENDLAFKDQCLSLFDIGNSDLRLLESKLTLSRQQLGKYENDVHLIHALRFIIMADIFSFYQSKHVSPAVVMGVSWR